MAMKAVIAKLEDVAEGLRGEYKKGDDGKFYLDVEDLDSHTGVTGLKKNRDDLIGELSALKKRQKQYGDVTPEQITELKAKLESTKTTSETEKKTTESRIAALEASNVESKAETARANQSTLDYYRDGEIAKGIAAHKGNAAFLSHNVKPHVKCSRSENGDMSAQVVDGNGAQRFQDGQPMTIGQLVGEMAKTDTYAAAFPSSGAGGSGSQGGSNDPNVKTIPMSDIGKFAKEVAEGTMVVQDSE